MVSIAARRQPLSINDLTDEIESIALAALFDAKALRTCEFHPDARIRVFNPEAERKAYQFATHAVNVRDEAFLREDVVGAVKYELDKADDECNQCANAAD